MKKYLVFILVGAMFSFNASAQTKEAAISFTKEVHDFGTFSEGKGKQTVKFQFTNTGGEALVLKKVKASCGCTATDYTKKPIPPGGKGFVSAVYNPKNRPGKFNKSITVTTNSSTPTKVLRIKGVVTPKVKTIKDIYPHDYKLIRLKNNHKNFGKVTNMEVKTDTISFINSSDSLVTLSFNNVPKHIKLKTVPEILKPNQKGVIEITYDGKLNKTWGFHMDRITIVMNNEKADRKNRLSVSADLTEDFSKLSDKDRENAPVMEFPVKEFNFGTINQGEKRSYDFEFTNTGKSDLIIRRVKTSCGCTASSPDRKMVEAGQTSKIATTFNSAGKRGNIHKTVTVITNDPVNPSIILKITGVVNTPNKTQKKK